MIPVGFFSLCFSFQWMFSDCVGAAATAAPVKDGQRWADGDPPGGVDPETSADPRRCQTHCRTLPPQKEDHGQPLHT